MAAMYRGEKYASEGDICDKERRRGAECLTRLILIVVHMS